MPLVLTLLAFATALLLAFQHVMTARLNRRYGPCGEVADVDGLRLHYVRDRAVQESGALPVVFIHGASGNLREPRRSFAGRLSTRDTVYFDRPGHGHSTRDHRSRAAPDRQAQTLKALLDHLGIEKAIIVGHSWGGAVAAAFACRYPATTAGLIFVAPATHPWPGGVDWYYRLASHRLTQWLFTRLIVMPVGLLRFENGAASVFAPNPLPEDYIETSASRLMLRPGNFAANAEDVADLKANVTRLSPAYRAITAPTVIITGDSDSVVWPSIHSEGLRQAIAGAEMVVLPGCGHMPHHVHPEEVLAAIARIDSRLAARST